MTRRTIEAYVAALSFVDTNLIKLQGKGIIIDFEDAMRSALRRVSPDLPIFGCLFHFMQALQRKMKSMTTLFELVRTNEDAKFLFRKFQSLALLPANKIKDEFVILLREALDTFKFTAFAPFVEYFKKQWLVRVRALHFSVFKLDTRTTGPAEAFNGKVNKTFRTHGAFFQFVEALQKEETVKADQFSRDVSGILQPDRRKIFYKKRSELISKYSTQLEKKVITARHYLCIMANVNNEILYDEKLIFTHEVDIKLSNETLLMEGDDVPYVALLNDAIIIEDNNEKEKSPEPQRTRRKRTLAEVVDADHVQSKRPKRRNPATESTAATDAPMQTRSKRAVLQSSEANKRSTPKQTTSRTKQASTRAGSKQKKQHRAHVVSDEDSNSDETENDSHVYDIMERISRNGPSMINLRKRFQELEKQEKIPIDPDNYKCIICCERKKNTILFPCLHQHTCGPCWIMWKIQQINSVPLELMNDEADFDEAAKPKCPVCRQGVEEFKEARN